MKDTLTVLAVDDHPLFLKGIAECLSAIPFVTSVNTCSKYDDLCTHLSNHVPDVIFLDLNLGNSDGFAICEEIKAAHKDVFIAILTQYNTDKFVTKAREHGAGAYFIKNTEPAVFAKFLRDYKDGKVKQFAAYTSVDAVAMNEHFEADSFELVKQLSKREKEIMQLLVKGIGREEIQASLNITYDTFKSHRTSILQKLKLKSVTDLIIFAVRNKLKEAVY